VDTCARPAERGLGGPKAPARRREPCGGATRPWSRRDRSCAGRERRSFTRPRDDRGARARYQWRVTVCSSVTGCCAARAWKVRFARVPRRGLPPVNSARRDRKEGGVACPTADSCLAAGTLSSASQGVVPSGTAPPTPPIGPAVTPVETIGSERRRPRADLQGRAVAKPLGDLVRYRGALPRSSLPPLLVVDNLRTSYLCETQ